MILYIGGNTYFKKNFKLSKYTLYIDGNAEFDDTLDLSNNATICVNGNLDVKHNKNINQDGSSKIYTSKLNAADFEAKCKRNTSSNETVILGKVKISPNFQYNY